MSVPARDRKSVYVGGLPITATDDELRCLFVKYGVIRNIVNKCMQGFAFIHYYEDKAVAALLIEPEVRLHGQLLKVDSTHFGVSSREHKLVQREAEDQEKLRKLEEMKDESYIEEETEAQKELRLQREATSRAKDEEIRRRREEYEAAHGKHEEEEEIDEMPVIKKRTPTKKKEEEVKAVKAARQFTFTEPSGVAVTVTEVYRGAAHYTFKGVTKPLFTKVEFNEDEDGDFIDFDELDASLGIPHEAIPSLVAFFNEVGITHNHKLQPEAEAEAAAPTPSPQGVQPTATAPPPNPTPGRGRGRGRGRGQN